MHSISFSKHLVSILGGGLMGLSMGCVLGGSANDDDDDTVGDADTGNNGPGECGSLLSNSHEGNDGMCYCDAGHTWENPDDPDDYDCEEIDPRDTDGSACNEPNSSFDGDTCYCDAGYIWCSNDPNDYSCCPDPAQETNADDTLGSTSADDSSTGVVDDTGGNDDGATPDPLECTAETEGARFCSNSAVTGPEGSTLWNCIGGSWVEATQAELDEECVIDQYEFAYGCTDDEETMTVGPVCGFGPGTPCEGDMSSCADDDVLEYCQWGKLSSASCLATCQDPSQKMTFDHGFCTDVPEAPGGFDCVCCDSGDKGCPV